MLGRQEARVETGLAAVSLFNPNGPDGRQVPLRAATEPRRRRLNFEKPVKPDDLGVRSLSQRGVRWQNRDSPEPTSPPESRHLWDKRPNRPGDTRDASRSEIPASLCMG